MISAVDDPGQEKEKETDDQGEDALYSSPKGKGMSGKTLECWTCGGRGHPSRLCPSDTTSPSSITCNECGGKGHIAISCPSGKGGKGKGKDNGKGTPWTGQKGTPWTGQKGTPWFKGGKKGFKGKGKGHSKGKGIYGVDGGQDNYGWDTWNQYGYEDYNFPCDSNTPWLAYGPGGENSGALHSMGAPPGIRWMSSVVAREPHEGQETREETSMPEPHEDISPSPQETYENLNPQESSV